MARAKIVSVAVTPGCISCGTCEAICPGVFKVDGVSKVLATADFDRNAPCIREAADLCPVSVIEIEEDEPAGEGSANAGV